jgi:hypothetical protein
MSSVMPSTGAPSVWSAPAAGGAAPPALRALKGAGIVWLGVAVLGQLVFATYVLLFYGASAMGGDFASWAKVLPKGMLANDPIGNAALVMHILPTVVIVIGGALQLLPIVRRRWPALHRWNGRVYMVTALVMSATGLLLLLTRDTAGSWVQHLGIGLNGVVIVLCAVMAWRAARSRRFDAHRQWALRLFLVVSGVWFFRVGLMAWLMIHRAPVGFDPETFSGPFLSFLSFAQFLLPLLILQLYFWAQGSTTALGTPLGRWGVTALLGVCTLLTGLGLTGATLMMWLPRM